MNGITYPHRYVDTFFEYVGGAISIYVLIETIFSIRTKRLVLASLYRLLEQTKDDSISKTQLAKKL